MDKHDLELLGKVLKLKNRDKRYVIFEHDDKGFYLRYAFVDGVPHDNRCLSWYDSCQFEAQERNGHYDGMTPEEKKTSQDNHFKYLMSRVGKIFELGSFTCGFEEDHDLQMEECRKSWMEYHLSEGPFMPGDWECKVGCPAKHCSNMWAKGWQYDSPVKCACWHLDHEITDLNDIKLDMSLSDIKSLLKEYE